MNPKTNYVARGLRGLGIAVIILGIALSFPLFILGIPVVVIGFCIFAGGILIE